MAVSLQINPKDRWWSAVVHSDPAKYDWSRHCGHCQGTRLAYLYEWRNMIWANPYIDLTGIGKWDGWTGRGATWPPPRGHHSSDAVATLLDNFLASPAEDAP